MQYHVTFVDLPFLCNSVSNFSPSTEILSNFVCVYVWGGG